MGFFDVINEPPVQLGDPYPLFNRISIETTSYCNRRCGFCPISEGVRDFQKKVMSTDLIESIACQLNAMNFDGVIQPFLLNEPLLDPRIFYIVKNLSSLAPRAGIYISTNGDPLGINVMKAVLKITSLYDAGLTCLNLNVYDEGKKGDDQLGRFNEIYRLLGEVGVELTDRKYSKHKGRKLCITDMRPQAQSTVKRTDLYYAKTDQERDALIVAGDVRQVHCARPHRHLIIRYDGKAVLCCAADPGSRDMPIVGDAATQLLREIWDGEAMFAYRYHLQEKRRDLPLCSTCTHRMAYSHVVRKVGLPDAVKEKWELIAQAEAARIRELRESSKNPAAVD
jgi:Iron-sulfur cluster-binding domain